jgi:hypothetical protein
VTAEIIAFPDFFRPASPRDEPCLILILPVVLTPRECPKITELRRQSSGGTCSGGDPR